MTQKIKINHIHDKHLNFLVGSGASAGLFPTLSLDIKNSAGESHTIETLATLLEDDKKKHTALFMHYYLSCIRPVAEFHPKSIPRTDVKKRKVITNYKTFLKTILTILRRKNDSIKKANLFTTNYDGCLAFAGDSILQGKTFDFIINDGTSGFFRRTLQAHNFNKLTSQTGIFERNQESLPQLNLVHIHGSAYWRKNSDFIEVDYNIRLDDLIPQRVVQRLNAFREILVDSSYDDTDLPLPKLTDATIDDFWEKYKKLPIVNPTKWKFHETVFEEHYYQMLRLMSYELERPNSVLITFGFSFADEHIYSLVKRALANPTLQIFIVCYSTEATAAMKAKFVGHANALVIGPDDGAKIDFTEFNEQVFTLDVKASAATGAL